jgi:hypothetical protein
MQQIDKDTQRYLSPLFPSSKPTGGADERPPKFPWGREQAATKELGRSQGCAWFPGAPLAPLDEGDGHRLLVTVMHKPFTVSERQGASAKISWAGFFFLEARSSCSPTAHPEFGEKLW